MGHDILESKVEARLFAGVKALGGRATKIAKVPGWPDRIVLLPGGLLFFVELKRPKGGRVAEHQALAHEIIRDLGQTVLILSNYEEVDDFLRRMARRIKLTRRLHAHKG